MTAAAEHELPPLPPLPPAPAEVAVTGVVVAHLALLLLLLVLVVRGRVVVAQPLLALGLAVVLPVVGPLLVLGLGWRRTPQAAAAVATPVGTG